MSENNKWLLLGVLVAVFLWVVGLNLPEISEPLLPF